MSTATLQKIKLLIFIPTLECGGTEKYISILCNHINTSTFNVTLVVLNNADPFYEIDNRVNLIDLKVQRVSRALFKIKKTIRQQQPDIILTTANHLNLLFVIFRKMLCKKIPIIARESSIVSFNNRNARFPMIYNLLVKLFFRRFNCIICQSNYMQVDLIKHFNIRENKTIVIHNPVEAMASDDSSHTSAPHKINKFITVARLSAEKGIDRLIQAVAGFADPYQYYIIGDGKQKQALQEQINDLQLQGKIFLTGVRANPWQDMGDADLFLSGSYYEGFPNAVLEAGAMGIPVVAFDAPGGTREIITDHENGLLVNDETAFTATIKKALQINFDRAGIIASTKKRFSINANISAVEELLVQLLPKKSSNNQ